MDRLSVAEAAHALGVTQAAVYKRIQRGTIEQDKDSEGHVFVYLDTSDMQPAKSIDQSVDTSNQTELVAELRAHNEDLRQEAEAWREESRRKDTIIMSLTQRIPELEPAREAPSDTPSPEPRESSSEPTSEDRGGVEVGEGHEKRSWVYRLFFGP